MNSSDAFLLKNVDARYIKIVFGVITFLSLKYSLMLILHENSIQQ